MIPRQLRVRNFLCYRDVPPLDFGGIHVACLTGPNGHGKSALLDAITWALWGHARAKRDDELIHQGESEMEVEFTFDLSGAVYRVLRKRDSSKGGRTVLDLQVQGQGSFRSLAEPTLRATQAAIVRLLRMDYSTFTNSAFLMQGRADAFTTRTPAERKQVLADILGLDLYDGYEQMAKERARHRERQIAELEGTLRDLDRELAREPEYQADLERATQRVTDLSRAVKEADAVLGAARHQQQALELQQARVNDLDRKLAQADRELAEIETQLADRQQRLSAYEATLSGRQPVEEGFAALTAARQAEATWNERLRLAAEIQEQERARQRIVDSARRELDLAVSRLAERMQDQQRRSGEAIPCEHELSATRTRLAQLAGRQEERDAASTQIQSLRHELAGLDERNKQLRRDMDAVKDKIELLQRETQETECPLCGQALPEDRRDAVLGQFEQQGKALADDFRANAARGRQIADESKRLEAAVQLLDRDLANLAGQRRREAQLEQALGQAQAAARELVAVRAEWAALDARLQGGDYATAEQSALARLRAELEALGYDPVAHQQARSQTASLAEFETAYQRLQTALDRLEEERNAIGDLRARKDRWQEAVAADRAQRSALAAEVARLPEVAKQVSAQAAELDELQAQSSRARLALGAAQQKLDYCRNLAVERARRSAEQQRLNGEKAILDELRLAFGKKGIQAMIIEAAIPEIEFEANRLLARMTDGRMHVRLETQRETLKGDSVETLDINIADELGTRPYELYSGGEAFRVNLTIRIALSKLLAHRAGAQLQTLVIDEGFGTQDADGRERLVEAIHSIQDDFACILVITHIEELKDAFPVRIQVHKTAQGSQISLS